MRFEAVQDYLLESFKKYDKNIAVTYLGKSYTYSELEKDADRIAGWLVKNKAVKGKFIGVLTDNKFHMLSSMIGIMKVGGVFVPLDLEFPMSRLDDMVGLSQIEYLLMDQSDTSMKLCSRHQDITSGTVFEIVQNQQYDSIAIDAEYNGEDSLYMYFTSGTTGKPKPILGVNKSLAHFIDWEITEFCLDEECHTSQFTAPCHDPYLRDVLVPLFTGGTLCIPESKEIFLSHKKVTKWMEDENVTLVHCTPSLFTVLNNKELTASNYSTLKYVLLAGEKVVPNKLIKWYEVFNERIQLVNLYGPTETTLAKFFYRIGEKDLKRNSIPIGKPISGAQAILLDPNLKPCGKGMVGEIYIRTPYGTRGYYNDKELTDIKFIPNPFGSDTKDKLYKTGDLARVLADNNFEFIGRADRQIKIRGFRVELSDIENTLLQLEHVKEAVVVYESSENRHKLKAFLILENAHVNFNIGTMKSQLYDMIPDYMIPAEIYTLNAMPLTGNGKVDYNALLQYKPVSNRPSALVPKTNTELILHEIWCNLLDMESVETKTPFFAAGGNSISAMQLISEVKQKLKVELPLGAIFEPGTIKGISAYIDDCTAEEEECISVMPSAEYYPVTSAQKRMYLMYSIADNKTVYNLPNVIQVKGIFDFHVFKQSIYILTARHESFRTKFIMKDNDIVQKVSSQSDVEVLMREIKLEELDAAVDKFITPFYLEEAPLLRAQVLKVSEEEHYLLFDMHHIIADGTSLSIFTKELMELCTGGMLPELKVQFKDYASWQLQTQDSKKMKEKETFWMKEFDEEIPSLNLLTDFQRPPVKTYDGEKVSIQLSDTCMKRVLSLAEQYGITKFGVLYSAYVILMHKYTGQDMFITGTSTQGRRHLDVQNMIGMFVNTLPVKNNIDNSMTLDNLLKTMNEKLIQCIENQDYPLDELVTKLDLPRDTSRNPLFDTVFTYHNYGIPKLSMGGLSISEYPLKNVTAKFDLEFAVIEKGEETTLQVEYCTNIFKESTVKNMLIQYGEILEQMADTSIQIADIGFQSGSCIGEAVEYPKLCLHELIEEQVAKTPENMVLKLYDKTMSYKEFNKRANQIAAQLRERGVKPNDVVAITAERSMEMIIGIYSILKSGGAYLPIDPTLPSERIKYILEDSKAKILLTYHGFSDTEIPVMDLAKESVWKGETDNLKCVNVPEDLAYIIYTSGTTGKPKGVGIEHHSISNFLQYSKVEYITKPAVAPLFTNYSFDLIIPSIYLPLISGGTLIVYNQSIDLDIDEVFKNKELTFIKLTPSHLKMAASLYNKDVLPNLETIIAGGESLDTKTIRQIHLIYGRHINIYNSYGPTETTVSCSLHKYIKEDDTSAKVSIGRAVHNAKIYIMNGTKLCGTGMPGEVCITGEGVARGYLNNPELTRKKFVKNLYGDGYMYRSGDLAKMLENGEIEYINRMDQQVKVRGYRIELGEIENILNKIEYITQSTVVFNDDDGKSELNGYVVSDMEINESDIKDKLKEQLPGYMIPSNIMRIESMPVTKNGKVDKRALPIFSKRKLEIYTEPENEVEKSICEAFSIILGKKTVGVRHNFFELGGDSIKALQIISELKKRRLTTEMSKIFKHQTPRELAPYITNYNKTAEQGMVNGEVELSPIQNWFLKRDSKDISHWNQAVLLETESEVDLDALVGAAQCVVLHHDALRCIFKKEETQASAYNRGLDDNLYEIKIFHIPEDKDEEKFIKKHSDAMQQSIQLESGPLLKIGVFNGTALTRIFIGIHHLVVDSISWRILIEDFLHAYSMIEMDEEVKLESKTDSFKTWSKSLRRYLEEYDCAAEAEYWMGIKNTQTAALNSKPLSFEEDSMYNNVERILKFTKEDTEKLVLYSNHAYNTETVELLLTGLGLGLSKWNQGGDKFYFNLEGHGRENIIDNIDISRTVGWFTSVYPVLIQTNPSDSLENLIKNVKEELRRVPNKGIGYGILNELEESEYYHKLNINSEIGFSYFGEMNHFVLNDQFKMLDASYGQLVGNHVKRPYILNIIGFIENGSLCIKINYNKLQFAEFEIQRLMSGITTEINSVAEHCSSKSSTEYTPDDFGNNEISLEELDSILEASKKIS